MRQTDATHDSAHDREGPLSSQREAPYRPASRLRNATPTTSENNTPRHTLIETTVSPPDSPNEWQRMSDYFSPSVILEGGVASASYKISRVANDEIREASWIEMVEL